MSYTLRGRVESRLAALLPVVLAACGLALAGHRWWPVEAAGLMLGLGLALDVQAYHRLLPYQPGWASLPLGALELGALLLLMRLAGVAAPAGEAVALFAAGWALAQILGHAGFPLLRHAYAEDGGELGRLGAVTAVLALGALGAAGGTAYALRPPVVHLAAGVYRGPLVIDRREVLEGEPGAVVRGGIVVRANGVTIRDLSVVGGENGIEANGVRGTVLDHVTVSGAKLNGILVKLGGVTISHCTVDMLGNEIGKGINISYTMDMGMTMVDGCTVTGGMEGITTHSSMTEIAHNLVTRTRVRGISMTEMSMGTISENEVRDARGVGIFCNDRSLCTVERNTVLDTHPQAGDPTARGFGVLVSFQSEAHLRDNRLAANPVATGAVVASTIFRTKP